MDKKKLIVISSPSGGGKSTLAKHILNNYKDIDFSVSCVTRKMRAGEIDGVHYHFIEKSEFELMIEKGELIEYEQIFDNYYGTRKADVEKALANNRLLLFDIDFKGAYNLRTAFPKETLLVFIAPPNVETLESRLRNRSTESEEQIQIRLSRAKLEIENSKNFDYTIINDVLETAIKDLDVLLLKSGLEKK